LHARDPERRGPHHAKRTAAKIRALELESAELKAQLAIARAKPSHEELLEAAEAALLDLRPMLDAST
jgi:hypothetical protein